MIRLGRVSGMVAVAFLLAACGQSAQAPASAPSGPVEDRALDAGAWVGFPTAESARISGSTITMGTQGGAMVPVENNGAAAGDMIVAYMTISGAAEGPARIALLRHCNEDRGDEGESREITLTTEPTRIRLAHTFSQAYDCVRVQVYAVGTPATVTIDNLSVVKVQ
jgi:hypothetical protein